MPSVLSARHVTALKASSVSSGQPIISSPMNVPCHGEHMDAMVFILLLSSLELTLLMITRSVSA